MKKLIFIIPLLAVLIISCETDSEFYQLDGFNLDLKSIRFSLTNTDTSSQNKIVCSTSIGGGSGEIIETAGHCYAVGDEIPDINDLLSIDSLITGQLISHKLVGYDRNNDGMADFYYYTTTTTHNLIINSDIHHYSDTLYSIRPFIKTNASATLYGQTIQIDVRE